MLISRKISVCVTIILLGVGTRMQAQSTATPAFPASPDPDRVVLNVTPELSNSVAISWRTCDTVKAGFAEIMPVTADPKETKNASRHSAKTEAFKLQNISVSYHSVSINNLVPNTTYMYRVGSGNHWSEWFHVKTASKSQDKVSFIYFGDVQVGIKPYWSRVIRQAYAKMPDANLVLYAGDIVNRGLNDHEWGELFYGGNFIHSMIPAMVSPGNHEHADNAKGENELTTLWRPQFNLPENGPAGLEETCYYSDVQGVRFISLNSQAIWFGGDLMEKQKTWLHSILKNNPNEWTCIVFHHPVYSVKANRDNTNMREQFQPIFDQYKVDLVLQGHDHAYARGMKNVPTPNKGQVSNTMYVVSMSGSKMYEENKQDWMDKTGGHIQLYQLITIEGNKLIYKSYTATGSLFDSFMLKKGKSGKNKLLDLPRSERF